MILDELALYAEKRVESAKDRISADEMKAAAKALPKGGNNFKRALKKTGISFIAEIKKASPSKGIIDEKFDYLGIAKEYEKIGTDCISCLTEPRWFLGSDEIFKTVRKTTALPMLRKDFTVDEYQIYEAKCMGADAVLLICAILPPEKIEKYLKICSELGLDALVEAHNDAEVKNAVNAGAEIIGVNNRNLKDFSVQSENAVKLREFVPKDRIFVAESGIKTAADIKILKNAGADAVLIGETLMRAKNRAEVFRALKGAAQ